MIQLQKSIFPLFLIFLIFLNTGNAQSSGRKTSAWSAEMYDEYDYTQFAGYAPAQQTIALENVDYALLNAAIFYETNRQRALHRVPPLQYSAPIARIAQEHSYDMVKYNFYAHESVVPGKRTLTDRMRRAKIRYGGWAENIHDTFGIGYESGRSVFTPNVNGGYFSYDYKGKPIQVHTYLSFAKSVVKGWMESEGHRVNLLNSDYRYIGCGTYLYYDKTFYDMPMFKATQDFCTAPGSM